MNIADTPFQDFNHFLLIFIRVGIILFLLPFFNSRRIQVMSKVGLTFIIAILLYPVIDLQPSAMPASTIGIVQLIGGELVIGMILGLMVQVFFEGVKVMGEMVGFQTGLSIANIIDPQSGMQLSIFSNMAYLLAMILFLLFNGHHVLLNALKSSFEIIQVGTLSLNPLFMQKMISHVGQMFVIGIKIGAPAIAALLFTKIVFGLITKFIPQMNIMIVAFPAQIAIGLLFFGISLRLLLVFVENHVDGLEAMMMTGMRGM